MDNKKFKYEYKKQGDGRDSWKRTEIDDNGNTVEGGIIDMIYENPFNKSNVNVIELLKQLPAGEIEEIRNLLKPS